MAVVVVVVVVVMVVVVVVVVVVVMGVMLMMMVTVVVVMMVLAVMVTVLIMAILVVVVVMVVVLRLIVEVVVIMVMAMWRGRISRECVPGLPYTFSHVRSCCMHRNHCERLPVNLKFIFIYQPSKSELKESAALSDLVKIVLSNQWEDKYGYRLHRG
jgi:hypothetical protein